MRTIRFRADRNECLAKELPSVGDQLDAIWNILLQFPQLKPLVQADPVFQRIQAVKDKFPKG